MGGKRAMKMLAASLAFCMAALLCHGARSEQETAHPPGEYRKTETLIGKAPQGKAESSLPSGEERQKTQGMSETKAVPTGTVRELPGQVSSNKPAERQAEAREKPKGYYIVKTAESLSRVAARDEVYGDPLKWPILYFYNKDKIGELQLVDGFLDRGLPEGERLKIITPRDAQENLRQRAGCAYAVNVLSARTQKRLISSAIRLMREGYPVYITSAMVKGREWIRLRVGFFQTRLDASLERMKINDLLRIHNSWVTELDQDELEEFGGLIPRFHKGE